MDAASSEKGTHRMSVQLRWALYEPHTPANTDRPTLTYERGMLSVERFSCLASLHCQAPSSKERIAERVTAAFPSTEGYSVGAGSTSETARRSRFNAR